MKKVILLTLLTMSLSINLLACASGTDETIDRDIFTRNDWHQPISGVLTTNTAYNYDSSIYNCNWKFRHGAYDIEASAGTSVYSVDNGEVLHIVRNNSVTLNTSRIYIKHNSDDGDFIAHYGHVSAKASLNIGDKVEKGEEIGQIVVFGTPTHIHFGISDTGTDNRIYDATFGSIKGDIVNPIDYLDENENLLSRAEALGLILDKFNITTLNAGFNNSIFGTNIVKPTDVENSSFYDYIVTGYNKGIVKGSSSLFRPTDTITFAEFLIMLERTIPIPLDNPTYKTYNFVTTKWYYKYAKAAYNAKIIDNIYYDFDSGIQKNIANALLTRAYNYYMGVNSGISIYANWSTKYTDIDLYLYSPYNGNSKDIKHNDNYVISNMTELKNSGGIIYWNNHSSTWGGNLDYDSWGGSGNQPWSGDAEERITVDSQMVRRPGKYSIILCYYSGWENSSKPSSASVEWWGINGGKNINKGGGVNFKSTISVGECNYVGYLNTPLIN